MEFTTERFGDETITKVRLYWFALAFKGVHTEQGAQGDADGDQQQDEIDDQPYEEPHVRREGGWVDNKTTTISM